MKRIAFTAILLICSVTIQSCTNDIEEELVTTGTIIFLSFEGGFYGIKGDDGRNYDPVNLAVELRKEGLRVRFRAKELANQTSVHQWGTIIEILDIQKL